MHSQVGDSILVKYKVDGEKEGDAAQDVWWPARIEQDNMVEFQELFDWPKTRIRVVYVSNDVLAVLPDGEYYDFIVGTEPPPPPPPPTEEAALGKRVPNQAKGTSSDETDERPDAKRARVATSAELAPKTPDKAGEAMACFGPGDAPPCFGFELHTNRT